MVDTKASCNFNSGYDRVVTLAQQGKISFSPNLILLDSCSMCSVWYDSSLLHSMQHFTDHGLYKGCVLCPMVERWTVTKLEVLAH